MARVKSNSLPSIGDDDISTALSVVEERSEEPKAKKRSKIQYNNDSPTSDVEVRGFKITKKGKVIVTGVKEIIYPLEKGEEFNFIETRKFREEVECKPHSDLDKSMKKLRKYALELNEMEVSSETKDISTYSVIEMKIKGSYRLKQCRVEFKLGKLVNRTKKIIPIPVSEVSMYGDKAEYVNIEKMTQDVEAFMSEILLFCNGKGQRKDQMSLW